jgi:hypothetical protein
MMCANSQFTTHRNTEESQAKIGIFKPCEILPIAFAIMKPHTQNG